MARKPKHDITDQDIAGAYFGNARPQMGYRGSDHPITSNPLGYWGPQEVFSSDGPTQNKGNQTEFRRDYYNERWFEGPRQYPRTYQGSVRVPMLPPAQSMKTMPPQLAAFSDSYNKSGLRASTANVVSLDKNPEGQESRFFLDNIDTVVINPKYKQEAVAKAATLRAKSKKLTGRTRYRVAESADEILAQYAQMDQMMKDLAEKNSLYFNKNFVVLKNPKTDIPDQYGSKFPYNKKTAKQYERYLQKGYENVPMVEKWETVDYGKAGMTLNGKYYDPNRTLRLDVYEEVNPNNYGSAPNEWMYQDVKRQPRKGPKGGPEYLQYEQYRPVTTYQDSFSVQNPLPPRTDNPTSSSLYSRAVLGSVSQHEFGHVVGVGHSTKYNDEWQGDFNTVMSYQRDRNRGATLLPSDINMWKEFYDRQDPASRAEKNKKKVSGNQLKKR